MYLNFTLDAVFSFFSFAGEWLDLNEHDYKIFGSQFSELERVLLILARGVLQKRQDLVLLRDGWEL